MDEATSLTDETSSLTDETSSLTDEDTSLRDETSSLRDEEVATTDAPAGLRNRFLSAWNSNPVQMRLMLISLLLYMADIITDIMLAVQYYSNGDYYWFGWTIGFVMAMPAVMNFLLLRYDVDLLDIRLSLRKWERCLLNFSCFALPLKYVEIINLLDGRKKMKESLKEKLHIWHLIEAMSESLPQLCLQLYIILTTHEHISVMKVIAMVISLLAVVKTVATIFNITKITHISCIVLVVLLICLNAAFMILSVGMALDHFDSDVQARSPWYVVYLLAFNGFCFICMLITYFVERI